MGGLSVITVRTTIIRILDSIPDAFMTGAIRNEIRFHEVRREGGPGLFS